MITSLAAQSLAGVASRSFSIPSSAKLIRVMMSDINIPSTHRHGIRIGPTGGPETSGYLGARVYAQAGPSSAGGVFWSICAEVGPDVGAFRFSGSFGLALLDPATNRWGIQSFYGLSVPEINFSSGVKGIAGPISTLQYVSTDGTVFTSGKVGCWYMK